MCVCACVHVCQSMSGSLWRLGGGLALCGTHRPIAHQTPCPLWGFVSAQHSGLCLRCLFSVHCTLTQLFSLRKKKSESESISETMSLFCLFMSSKFDSLHDRCLCFVCFFAIEPNPKTLNIIKILLYKNESKRISHDQKTSSLNVRKVIFNIQCYLNFYLLDSKKNVVATFKGVTHDLTAWSQS